MRYSVIGGGIGGLVVAYILSKKKHFVKLFEKTDTLGGLARTTLIDGKPLEVYYHHFDRTHTRLFSLCKELGIKIRWFNAKMGYLSNGVIYDFSTPFDLMRFKPLSLKDKANFATSYFFQLWQSQKVYDTIWKPLLIHKFGDHYKNITMHWIWSRPKCYGKLASIDGSCQALIDKLMDRILEFGGEIHLEKECDKEKYDAIVDTTPCKNDMLPVTCLMLVLDRPLTKYYWLNIGDLSFPFGVVVQKGNVVYITKYGKYEGDFMPHLKRINPDFKDSWVKEAHTFHDDYAQEISPTVEDRGLNNIIKKAWKTTHCC